MAFEDEAVDRLIDVRVRSGEPLAVDVSPRAQRADLDAHRAEVSPVERAAGNDQQTVVAARPQARHRSHRITTDAVGDEPLAVAGRVEITADLPSELARCHRRRPSNVCMRRWRSRKLGIIDHETVNKPQHAMNVVHNDVDGFDGWLLSIVSPERLPRILDKMFDDDEFLSPFGLRSLAKSHRDDPFEMQLGGSQASVGYEPGESSTGLFGDGDTGSGLGASHQTGWTGLVANLICVTGHSAP